MAKRAMIWGAAGGIGRALTEMLRDAGWQVIAVARDASELDAAVDVPIEADISDAFAVQSAVQAASFEVDEVDLWLYAAGDIVSAKVSEIGPGDWRRILDANLSGAYLATHFSLPLLAADAHVFYLGAISERLRLPGLSAYAAAKAGLEAFADALRKEQRGRRVTVVRPGAVATPFWDKVPMRLPKDAATPEKVAGRILQAYVDGQSGTLDLT
ncbi:MAG: SDR family NAD(P)-dependent oxidoreductase [Candidatus Promineifilaceae bacterium]|jgi:NAD(P)-dependent dehydrogenase (short-subunit alcohol dehydrogenase family)